MKKKIYTLSHDINYLEEIDASGEIFTAEEHAYVMEKEFSSQFTNTHSLVHWYLKENADKLSALAFLIKYIPDRKYNNILSLGAGPCVLEYLLMLALPPGSKIIATDFDPWLIQKATELLPGIHPFTFDFCNENLKNLQERISPKIDIAIFFGSSYVMDDQRFISFFSSMKDIGIKQIIDFQSAYIDRKTMIKNFLLPQFIIKSSTIRKILRKPPLQKDGYVGKFHGYSRSLGEWRKLYNNSGVKIVEETSIEPYKYVAICDCV